MLAVMAGVSDTVVHDLIHSWKRARLSSGIVLGFPKSTLLGRIVEFGLAIVAGSRGKRPVSQEMGVTDADNVQKVVEKMPYELKSVFEAYHLGIIRDEVCRREPHNARAMMLGISYKTYKRRRDAGWCFIQKSAEIILDGCP